MALVSVLVSSIASRLKHVYENAGAAQDNAWLILQNLTLKTREQLIIMHELELTDLQQKTLDDILEGVVNQSLPLQYALGTVPFCGVTITVRPPILIPRPETEEWVSELIAHISPLVKAKQAESPFKILDLCTGSGCVALALAHEFKNAHVMGADIATEAISLANENALKNNLLNAEFVLSDLYQNIERGNGYDCIVANPPYLTEADFKKLDTSVSEWEDKRALVSYDNGLGIIKTIIAGAPFYLRRLYGCSELWIEIDYRQAAEVQKYMELAGFARTYALNDITGRPRVVRGIYE